MLAPHRLGIAEAADAHVDEFDSVFGERPALSTSLLLAPQPPPDEFGALVDQLHVLRLKLRQH